MSPAETRRALAVVVDNEPLVGRLMVDVLAMESAGSNGAEGARESLRDTSLREAVRGRPLTDLHG